MTIRALVTGTAALLSAALLGAGAAQAIVPLTAVPGTNAITFTFHNNDDSVTPCRVLATGPVYFQSDYVRIAPYTAQTITYVDVPAGNYEVLWDCRAFNQGNQLVVVPGAALPGSAPHPGSTSNSPGLGSLLPTGSFGSLSAVT